MAVTAQALTEKYFVCVCFTILGNKYIMVKNAVKKIMTFLKCDFKTFHVFKVMILSYLDYPSMNHL